MFGISVIGAYVGSRPSKLPPTTFDIREETWAASPQEGSFTDSGEEISLRVLIETISTMRENVRKKTSFAKI